MPAVERQVDPGEVGFDAERLARIDRHFARYVDDGRLAGWQVAVTRRGRVAHTSTYGVADLPTRRPFTSDAIVRLYSMTKPITSVAAMILVEEGRLSLGFDWGAPPDADLAECCDRWAGLPLLFEPGTEWNYSVATDVLGHVVEQMSGRSLGEFFAERVLGPLGMVDTAFSVPSDKLDRFASLYVPHPTTGIAVPSPIDRAYDEEPRMLSGGGGLVGTAHDYLRFCHMLLGRGSLDGTRVLGSRTVGYMTRNHLPGGADLEQIGRPGFNEASYHGIGFGLGFSVLDDPVANRVPGSKGAFAWGGAASTAFWVDPVEEICVVFLTQLLPSSTHPIRPELRQLVHQALVD